MVETLLAKPGRVPEFGCSSRVERDSPALRLTELEVARRAGSTPERVRALVELGVLAPGPDSEEPFVDADAMRVELVEELAASGIPPEKIAAAMSGGALTVLS